MNIKDAMLSGYGADQWHKDQIKKNNRKWFLLTIFICTIFIGKDIVYHNKVANILAKNKQNDSLLEYREQQIITLQLAVDSAVYFSDILKGRTTK